ncbi:MAG: MHYT domain-containing protein, partial [bacterium]
MSHPLLQSYSYSLVALSVAIGVLASLNALHIAGRIYAAEGRARALWLAGGAVTMGIGIWSMHFVGMLALQLPIHVEYRLPQLIESVGVAIGASGFALWVAARSRVHHATLLSAATGMGIAIAGMHYIGMAGMEMHATIAYDATLYALSVGIAVTASYVALFIARRLRAEETRGGQLARFGAALVMGAAIAGMHYTGMAAANFLPIQGTPAQHTVTLPPVVLATLVTIGGALLGGLALLAAMLDRLLRLRTAEAQLRAEKEAAEATSRAKSEFLSNMSHELRTPLNSIIGFSNLLLKNKADNLRPLDMTYLSRISSNGTHLLGVINGVLDLSKIEAGRMDLEMTDVDVDVVVHETLDELASQVQATNILLIADVADHIGALHADRARLKQIIINLVGNALKFTERGSVTVRVVSNPGSTVPVRLDVIDTGIGIPDDRREAVFEAFRQADATTTRKYGGTGLGLTITRALAELMGWRISVASEVGVGTTFSVHLTAVDGAEATVGHTLSTVTATEEQVAGTSSDDKQFVVLIIDDEEDARTLLKCELEESECRVVAASSADEGIAVARRLKPDLITLDIMMPGKNGWEALRELKADAELRHIPVVIVSVVANESAERGHGEAGRIDKPVTRE